MSTPETGPVHAATSAPQRQAFLRATMIVAVSVLLSRVLGFFREWTLAHQVGSNALTDAYYAAFTVPDMLNYLMAGGALGITFLPVFLEYFTARRDEDAWRVFSTVLTYMCLLLAVLLAVAEVYAPVLTGWLAPGFPAEQRELVTRLTRIMLPAQAFFFIGGVMTAVQYARGRFLVPSLAPLIYNGMIILFGALFSARLGVEAFSWGVLAGSLLGNCLLQIYGARRLGARFQFSLGWRHPGFRRFLDLTWPIMLGFSVIFVDDWAIRWFGSYLAAASISWLGYAKQLMRIVVGVFGQAAGVAAYPLLARLAAEKKFGEMQASLEDALRHVILTVVPASLLLALLSRPVVYALFSRTRMGPDDLEQTAQALMIFLIGAFAWSAQGILGRGFYALGDTITPTVVGSVLTLASLPLYWLGAREFQHLGLAAASTLGVMIYTLGLWMVLYRRLRISLQPIFYYLLRTLAASLAAAAVATLAQQPFESAMIGQSLPGVALQIICVATVFVACFLLSATRLHVADWRDLRKLLAIRRTLV